MVFLNKEIPGCGATTVALTDEHKTIICSPRNELLKNKHEQYPDTLLVIGGVDTKEIEAYLQTAELPKILVSYDSVYKLIGCIKYKSDWRVVVDEFQCLLADSSFKSEIELHFWIIQGRFRMLHSYRQLQFLTNIWNRLTTSRI